jgi:capsular exopolysaccharide synthesis family protein
MSPIAPNTRMIMLAALLLGLCIPLGIWYLSELFNSTVRGKKDLEGLTMPFLGEIPLHGVEKKSVMSVLKGIPGKLLPHKNEEEVHKVVVKKGSRNVVNEAFRVLRTNLEFMTKETNGDVIIISSYNPGSGKSFISMNLAVALAIKEKKVLLVDGDLRHASLSAYWGSPKKGLADYLSGHVDSLESLLVKRDKYECLHALPVGTIPPNPTELVAEDKFKDAIEKFKKEYDYVIIDCPPMDIMADTQIISQYADRTIFVVRAGLFERSMLSQLEETYKSGKYKNMSVVLNGTTSAEGRYGYKYGYRYGYKDGYRYNGYSSYGSTEDDKQ